jgi:hypothetical protein
MNLEAIEWLSLAIRIRHHNRACKETQLNDLYRYICYAIGETKEVCADRRTEFLALRPSI